MTPYRATEEENARVLIEYWKQRGIDIKVNITGDYQTVTLRSNLVLKVPKFRHDNVHGMSVNEIKHRNKRKWR